MNTDYMDITLPEYTKCCPHRSHVYLALMQKHRADWRAQDYADWQFATGWKMPPYPAPINPPVVKCRCCNRPMVTAWQEPIVTGRDGYWMVTCETHRCSMKGFTFSAKCYSDVDLSVYAKGKS